MPSLKKKKKIFIQGCKRKKKLCFLYLFAPENVKRKKKAQRSVGAASCASILELQVASVLGPYGCTAAAVEKVFGAGVAGILESQRAARAICNPQCEQIEGHFKYSHSHVIASEMEADLRWSFSAVSPSSEQHPPHPSNEPTVHKTLRTSVCVGGFYGHSAIATIVFNNQNCLSESKNVFNFNRKYSNVIGRTRRVALCCSSLRQSLKSCDCEFSV